MAKPRTQTQPAAADADADAFTLMANSVRRLRNVVNAAATAIDFVMAVNGQEEGFFEPYFSVPSVMKTLNAAAAELLDNSYEDLDSLEDFMSDAWRHYAKKGS